MNRKDQRNNGTGTSFQKKDLELVRRMFEEAPLFFGITEGESHRVKYVNRALRELVGKATPLEEGSPASVILPRVKNEDQDEVANSLSRLDAIYESGEPMVVHQFPNRLDRTGDGEPDEMYFNFIYQPLKDRKEDVYGLLLAGYEVTGQVETTREIGQTDRKLKMALEGAQMGLWEAKLTDNTAYANDQCKRHFGLPVDRAFIAENIYGAIHPEDRDRVQAAFEEAVEKREIYSARFRIPRSDGSVRWLLGRGQPLMNEERDPVRLIGITYDITEQKASEEKLKNAMKVREDFIAIASHELQTPVTTIKTMSELFELRLRDGGLEEFADRVGEMNEQIDQLSRLTKKLLNVTAIRE